jgi:hypothetical protein
MASPFPGMDPYLEQHWGDVHQSLIIYAGDHLQKLLPKDLRARVEERVFVESAQDTRRPAGERPHSAGAWRRGPLPLRHWLQSGCATGASGAPPADPNRKASGRSTMSSEGSGWTHPLGLH